MSEAELAREILGLAETGMEGWRYSAAKDGIVGMHYSRLGLSVCWLDKAVAPNLTVTVRDHRNRHVDAVLDGSLNITRKLWEQLVALRVDLVRANKEQAAQRALEAIRGNRMMDL